MGLCIRLFAFYQDCDFEKALTELGTKVSDLSGFLNLIVNIFFRYETTIGDINWRNNVIASINSANLSNDPVDWEHVGGYLGKLFAEFMYFEIPNYDYTYNPITTI